MNIAILGYGKEGQSAEKYFNKDGNEIKIFQNFDLAEIPSFHLENYDLVLRSPSIHPEPSWSSLTKYFFEHCPCQIIGVTGTKGKGTTCSLITSILEACGKKVWLVGNIGNPSIDVLDKIQPEDIVVYELSSFQLWDLDKSPHIAVVLRIEPDHLNVHDDFDDYVEAKSHIAAYQNTDDFCIYYSDNQDSAKIADKSAGQKLTYPIKDNRNLINETLNSLSLLGPHNRENAEAAMLAVATYFGQGIEDFIKDNEAAVKKGINAFHGLPHRLEFVRELNNVKYYDDNFATTLPALQVAINSFPEQKIVLIVGGRDKTNNKDLPALTKILLGKENLEKVILIGESGHTIFDSAKNEKFVLAETLEEAVKKAQKFAEETTDSIVLMSPAAASFDMFKDVYDRGEKFQQIVKGLN